MLPFHNFKENNLSRILGHIFELKLIRGTLSTPALHYLPVLPLPWPPDPLASVSFGFLGKRVKGGSFQWGWSLNSSVSDLPATFWSCGSALLLPED